MWFLLLLLLPGVRLQELEPSNGKSNFYRLPYNAVQFIQHKPLKQGPILFPNDAPPPPPTPLIVTSRPLSESIARSELNPNNTEAAQSQYHQVQFMPEYLGRSRTYRPFGYGGPSTPTYDFRPANLGYVVTTQRPLPAQNNFYTEYESIRKKRGTQDEDNSKESNFNINQNEIRRKMYQNAKDIEAKSLLSVKKLNQNDVDIFRTTIPSIRKYQVRRVNKPNSQDELNDSNEKFLVPIQPKTKPTQWKKDVTNKRQAVKLRQIINIQNHKLDTNQAYNDEVMSRRQRNLRITNDQLLGSTEWDRYDSEKDEKMPKRRPTHRPDSVQYMDKEVNPPPRDFEINEFHSNDENEMEKFGKAFDEIKMEKTGKVFEENQMDKSGKPFDKIQMEKFSKAFDENQMDKSGRTFDENQMDKSGKPFNKIQMGKFGKAFDEIQMDKSGKPFDEIPMEKFSKAFGENQMDKSARAFDENQMDKSSKPFNGIQMDKSGRTIDEIKMEKIGKAFDEIHMDKSGRTFDENQMYKSGRTFDDDDKLTYRQKEKIRQDELMKKRGREEKPKAVRPSRYENNNERDLERDEERLLAPRVSKRKYQDESAERQAYDGGRENIKDYNHGENYAFSYTVKDHKTGDDFSHSQKSTGSATNGEYRVRLPDGRMQIVSYTADENGYNAKVRYDEHSQAHNNVDREINNGHVYRPRPAPVTFKPVDPIYNNEHQESFENDEYVHQRYNEDKILKNSVTAKRPTYNSHNNYGLPQNNFQNYDDLGSKHIIEKPRSLNADRADDLTDSNNEFLKRYHEKLAENNNNNEIPRTKDEEISKFSDEIVDYSSELGYGNQRHKSKYLEFDNNEGEANVRVTPTYEELKEIFDLKDVNSHNNAVSTVRPYDVVTEDVVAITPKKHNLYTNINLHNNLISATPTPFPYSATPTTPSSYLYSTIANLKHRITFGKKPVLSHQYINKINKYLTYK